MWYITRVCQKIFLFVSRAPFLHERFNDTHVSIHDFHRRNCLKILVYLYFAVQVEAVLSSIQAKIIFRFGIKGVVDLNCCLYEFFLFFFFVSFVLSPLLALKMFLKRSDGCGPKSSLISTSASKARSFLNLNQTEVK